MRKDPILAAPYTSSGGMSAFAPILPDLPADFDLPAHLDRAILNRLIAAALHPDRLEAEEVLVACISEGLTADILIDSYIPTVARVLGEFWCVDTLGFAEVTIAVARLQGHVRILDQLSRRPIFETMDPPAILMVIPPNGYHTLGAMIALSKFRRLGASVRLIIAQKSEELAETLTERSFDMVAISASGCEKLELLRLLVEKVRKSGPNVPPIVIGGSILETDPEAHIHVGADYAAADPKEAMTLCGLMIPNSDANSRVSEV